MKKEFDVIVVLDGTATPGYNFPKNRVDRGIELYKKLNFKPHLIVTGRGYKDYLKNNGVLENSMFFLGGEDTLGEAYSIKKFLKQKEYENYKRIALVTDETHSNRALNIFKMIFNEDYEIDAIPASSGFGTKKKIKMYLYEKLSCIKKEISLLGVPNYDEERIFQRYSAISKIPPIRMIKNLISKLYSS